MKRARKAEVQRPVEAHRPFSVEMEAFWRYVWHEPKCRNEAERKELARRCYEDEKAIRRIRSTGDEEQS
jgi:hypothetical protein